MTEPEPLEPAVSSFLDEHVFSVAQLELLLLVREAGGEPRGVEALARDMYLPASSIVPWLDALTRRGLLRREGDGYAFAPADEDLRETMTQVADAYARRRVTVTRHVYRSKEDPAQRFSDAFRWRKDPER